MLDDLLWTNNRVGIIITRVTSGARTRVMICCNITHDARTVQEKLYIQLAPESITFQEIVQRLETLDNIHYS